ncbi:MAG: hypothetical protein NW207_06835 [Cytophagales bacterium]|nr:hypothetical protein [Cytophagales bacterium]
MSLKTILIHIAVIFITFSTFAQKSSLSKKNAKRTKTKDKSTFYKNNASGDENTQKHYNLKSPKFDASKNTTKVDISKAKKKKSSAEMNSNTGDIAPKIEWMRDYPGNSPDIMQDDKLRQTRRKHASETINSGDVYKNPAKNRAVTVGKYGAPIPVNSQDDIPKTKRTNKQRELSGSATGDLEGYYERQLATRKRKGKEAGNFNWTTPTDYVKDDLNREKTSDKEMGANSGDLEGYYERQLATRKRKGQEAGSFTWTTPTDYVKDDLNKEKTSDKEMGANSGDLEGYYERQLATRKRKGKEAGSFTWVTKTDYIKDDIAKQKALDKEIYNNTGDIIGGYIEKRNRERENNKKIISYVGNIDYEKIKKRSRETDALQHSFTGDILSKSVKAKKNDIRTRTRQMTSHEGDRVVASRKKGMHPSSVYLGGKNKESLAEKEKYRKKMVKKARRDKGIEDPEYFKKPVPKPKYDEKEWEIWELKSRPAEYFTK